MPKLILILAVFTLMHATAASAQEQTDAEAAELAKKLANPLASLVSVPIQFNWDDGYGPDDGNKLFANVQPVIPFSLTENWNLITRTILPVVINQKDVTPGSGNQTGLGDITFSMWLSPKAPKQMGGLGNLVWGVGLTSIIPTATSTNMGTDKLSVGPTFVALLLNKGWTAGMLINQFWSVAGKSGRRDVDLLYWQPFLSYTTPLAWTFGVNMESTYDWDDSDWTIPVNATVSKLTVIGSQRVQFQGGLRYWADTSPGSPDDVGIRFGVTFLFPK